MPRRLIVAALLCATAVAAASPPRDLPEQAPAVLTPFTAAYTVTRGRLRLGELRSTLRRLDDGRWSYLSESRATGFVALLRDIAITERTVFRLEDGRPVPLTHDYRMQGSRKNRDFSLAFDWVAREVRGVVRGEAVSESLPPGAVDRHATPLALAAALARGDGLPQPFVMVDRARLRNYHATVEGRETLATGAGALDVVQVLLVRVGEPERRFRFWLVPDAGHLAARIQSVDDDGDVITLQLKEFRVD